MIRNVIIHLLSEQPVVGDLLEAPAAGDVNLVCANLRTLDGKRPVFVDQGASTFVFPYRSIRFLEIRPESSGTAGARSGADAADAPEATSATDADLEIDENFLRRIREAWRSSDRALAGA